MPASITRRTRNPASTQPPAFPGVEAVVLAGGRSLRMGRDKARLRYRGRSLLSLSGDAARALGLPVRVIRRDEVPQCGPLGGIATALGRPRATTVLFLSCDMPRVQPALLKRLLARLGPSKSAAFVEVAGWVGFPCVIRSEACGVVRNQCESRERSLQALARSLSAVRVPIPMRDQPQLLNVNTPSAWEEFRASENPRARPERLARPRPANERPRRPQPPISAPAQAPSRHVPIVP